ncbi:MAG: type III-B CRISPR module RAMP protein Cmr6 [Pontiella sp.]
MSVFLPNGIKQCLPNDQEINASLLITKYAEVKTEAEKEDSAKIAARSCTGKTFSGKILGYSCLPRASAVAMKLMGRLIVDQSGGVQESNLCLHPHFGVPMIPGSAVKGAARHWLWEQWNEAEGAEKENLENELLNIFGGAENAGKVSFLPALPYGCAPLEIDVLTCHHMDYYSPTQPKERATDDENPNPQFFPVVKAGAIFEFVVMPTVRGTEVLAEKALGYLKIALEINGIGAKTSAGYGWFEEDRAATKSLKTEQKRAAEKIQQASMSPLELTKIELVETEGTGFGEAALRIIKSEATEKQRALIQVLGAEKCEEWKSWKKRARTKPKLQERVEKVLALAAELGEELI